MQKQADFSEIDSNLVIWIVNSFELWTHAKTSRSQWDRLKFDKLKIDVLQKVDLLAAARCNMFSHALIQYQDSLIAFWKKTAKTMGHVDTSFQGYQPYEFTYIRDLAEPSRQLAQSLKSPSKKSKKKNKDNADKVDDKDQVEEDQMNKDEWVIKELTYNIKTIFNIWKHREYDINNLFITST